jgi:YgiT-type zinc finger domain-containing protein
MYCIYCKGENNDNITTHVVKMKQCVIIIKDVPCSQCNQCGAIFYDNDVALQLEHIVSQMKTAITEVAIVNYTAA